MSFGTLAFRLFYLSFPLPICQVSSSDEMQVGVCLDFFKIEIKEARMSAQILRQLLRLLFTTHYSNRRIAKLVGVAPNTVRRYRKKLGRITFTLERVNEYSDSQLVRLFSEPKQADSSKRLPDWHHVHQLMQTKHQTLIQLWEEYRSLNPDDAYSYSQFTHYYRDFVDSIDVTMRQYYLPGEVTFVDFSGKRIPWYDSVACKQHYAEIFVGVTGYAQYVFAIAVRSQKLEDWLSAHQAMFDYYGGVTQLVVPDNLKSAVTKPGKTPVINASYQEMAEHYDFVIEPARVRRPQDKSLAEIGVLLVTRWIIVVLSRRQFFSIDEINRALRALLEQLNQRPFKRFEGDRLQRFQDQEHQTLKPLPQQPFEIGRWIHQQKVNRDYHIYVHGHAYSVPYELTSQAVDIKVTNNKVEVYFQHKLVAMHVRSFVQGGATTEPQHRPKSHRVYAEQSKAHFIQWAERIGQSALALVMAQFDNLPDYSMQGCKACTNLQTLAKQYGAIRFENACHCACDIKSRTVSSVRSILQCHLDEVPEDVPTQQSLPLHHNVRGAEYYVNGGQ